MGVRRKQHSADFKARVAMVALSGEKSLAELSSEFGVHPTMIRTWKQELTKRPSELSAQGNKAPVGDDAQKVIDDLHRKIGQLLVQPTAPSPAAWVANTGRGLLRQTRVGRGGGVTRWRSDAMNLWTAGCADTRLTAQARSPMDPGKTPCVSPTLPTGRRLPTSFTAPQQHQGLSLIPGKVKPSAGYQPLAYSSRNLSKRPESSQSSLAIWLPVT